MGAAPALGALLRCCPKLTALDLEGNPELLKTPEAIMGLVEALGQTLLPFLEKLSLRWCHIPVDASVAFQTLLEKCPNLCLAEADMLGNRGLQLGELRGAVARAHRTPSPG